MGEEIQLDDSALDVVEQNEKVVKGKPRERRKTSNNKPNYQDGQVVADKETKKKEAQEDADYYKGEDMKERGTDVLKYILNAKTPSEQPLYNLTLEIRDLDLGKVKNIKMKRVSSDHVYTLRMLLSTYSLRAKRLLKDSNSIYCHFLSSLCRGAFIPLIPLETTTEQAVHQDTEETVEEGDKEKEVADESTLTEDIISEFKSSSNSVFVYFLDRKELNPYSFLKPLHNGLQAILLENHEVKCLYEIMYNKEFFNNTKTGLSKDYIKQGHQAIDNIILVWERIQKYVIAELKTFVKKKSKLSTRRLSYGYNQFNDVEQNSVLVFNSNENLFKTEHLHIIPEGGTAVKIQVSPKGIYAIFILLIHE